jgi:hypothetical protein
MYKLLNYAYSERARVGGKSLKKTCRVIHHSMENNLDDVKNNPKTKISDKNDNI